MRMSESVDNLDYYADYSYGSLEFHLLFGKKDDKNNMFYVEDRNTLLGIEVKTIEENQEIIIDCFATYNQRLNYDIF